MYNRQIQTFVTAAECGSFTKAAAKLFITSASVMKQMNALEERLGIELFKRTSRGIVLTPAGISVYRDAKRIIAESEQAVERARQIAGTERHILRVGTSLLNPCRILMEFWKGTCGDNPAFQIRIVPFEDDRKTILTVISSLGKEIDIIAGSCGSREWGRRCSIYPIGQYRVCCAVSRKHRLAGKKKLSLSDLRGETLMMGARGDTPQLDALRTELETEYPEIHIMDTDFFYDAEVFNTCDQMNCVLLTLEVWKDVHPSLITIPVDWEYTVPYGLLYSKNPSPAVEAFVEVLRKTKKCCG